MGDISGRSALDYFPKELTPASLHEAAAGCMGCDLYTNATQTVFGEGPGKATATFIGEQPGDEEDLQGRPFVGPPDGFSTGRWGMPVSTVQRST